MTYVDLRPAYVMSLCSGGGGLDLGLRMALRASRVVCFVEIEAIAATLLVDKMETHDLDEAPVWSDLRTFDGRPWREIVDLVIGGFPCTDISNAGKRAGIEGEHSSLWFEFVRIIREVQPRVLFLENVAAIVNRGLERVLGDLASLGFSAEWDVFRASDVAAPHKRARWFCLADADSTGFSLVRRLWLQHREQKLRHDIDGPGGPSMGNAHDLNRQGRGAAGFSREARSAVGPQELGNPNGARREGRSLCGGERSDQRAAWRPSSPLVWPPGPDQFDKWAEVLAKRPDLEPSIRRMAHGVADRVDRLRILGNGVVPAQADLAFRTLAGRLWGLNGDPSA